MYGGKNYVKSKFLYFSLRKILRTDYVRLDYVVYLRSTQRKKKLFELLKPFLYRFFKVYTLFLA